MLTRLQVEVCFDSKQWPVARVKDISEATGSEMKPEVTLVLNLT